MQRGHGRVLVGREPVVDGGRYGYAGQVRKARQRMVDDLQDAGNRLQRRSDGKQQIEDKGREGHSDQGAGEAKKGQQINDTEEESQNERKGEMQEIEIRGGD